MITPTRTGVVPPPQPGRGSTQRTYLQELIRRWAESRGWRVVVEQPILDGLGFVDVVLDNGSIRVAVEVSVSSTTDDRLANIQKCLAAGFDRTISVAADRRSLQRFQKAVAALGDVVGKKLQVLSPEDLFAFLEVLNSEAPTTTVRTARGYIVRVKHGRPSVSASPTHAIAKTVIGALKRLGRQA